MDVANETPSSSPSSPRKRWPGWVFPAVKLAIVLAIAWGVHATIESGLKDLKQHDWDFEPAWLVAAGALYLGAMVPAGLFWRRVMIALGQQVGRREALRAYIIGHLGKYVPGKAMVLVLRSGMLRHFTDVPVVIIAIFVETLTMMAAGAFLAAAILAVLYWDQWLFVLLSFGLMVAMAVPTAPPIFRRLVKTIGRGKASAASLAQIDKLTYRVLAYGWLAMGLCWLLQGISLLAIVRGMGIDRDWTEIAFLTAIVSLSIVAGFVSFVPGGAGVRELVLLKLMAIHGYSDAVALAAPVLLRLVSLVAELGISAILYLNQPPRPGAPHSAEQRRDPPVAP